MFIVERCHDRLTVEEGDSSFSTCGTNTCFLFLHLDRCLKPIYKPITVKQKKKSIISKRIQSVVREADRWISVPTCVTVEHIVCPVESCHLWQTWVVGFQSCWELRAWTVAAPWSDSVECSPTMSCLSLSTMPLIIPSLFRSQMTTCVGNPPAENTQPDRSSR